MWPEGTYALPRSVHDCPNHPDVHWFTGSALTQWDDEDKLSSWTPGLHLMGPYSHGTFTWQTCSKIEAVMSDDIISAQPQWPDGSYCVYQMAEECPLGKGDKHPKVVKFATTIL